MILFADSEYPDQTARMRKLTWASLFAYTRKHIFTWRGPYEIYSYES